jgi:hypothetical protein
MCERTRIGGRSNPRMHPTPLRGPKIAAILKAKFGIIPFHSGGAGDAQAVRQRAFGRRSGRDFADQYWRTEFGRFEPPMCAFVEFCRSSGE